MAVFAFTGPATVAGTHLVRENLINLAVSKGHRVATSLTRSVTYLVTSTPNSGSRKNRTADAYGVQRITPTEFIELLGGKIELRLKDLQ